MQTINYLHVAFLALIQGLAELLPVSSSAHVIVAQKFLGYDPSSPEMTFLLVMLHTGTMFATLLYFGKRWKEILQGEGRSAFVRGVFIATLVTGVFGFGLKALIEKFFIATLPGMTGREVEIEHLFKNLPLISAALFAAGMIILAGSRFESRAVSSKLTTQNTFWIGLVQAVCLPFRGFSRSGATISTSMILGLNKKIAEEFSFALAIVLTPPVVLRSAMRLLKAQSPETKHQLVSLFLPGMVGMFFAFLGGLIALKWLSSWLENGKWKYFGYYCFLFSAFIFWFSTRV